MGRRRLAAVRLLAALTVLTGLVYIVWRWTSSLNWAAWWISVPLVLAETYMLADVALFALTVARARRRPEPPAPPVGASVDVFITSYNEPVDLVLATALAAKGIRYPHHTWILDDGNRFELARAAEQHGIGYVTRGPEWSGRPRHAKAGNLNNALLRTSGEFFLVLDADQVPSPDILDRTLGYFSDPLVAFVQTPQYFTNVPDGDPLGSQAPLFYGPIQQGKDGWNAAFFCGSNAVLRREAIMELGLVQYVEETGRNLRKALSASRRVIARARRRPEVRGKPLLGELLQEVKRALDRARQELKDGSTFAEVTFRAQDSIALAVEELTVRHALSDSPDRNALHALATELGGPGRERDEEELDTAVLHMTQRNWGPLAALESVQSLLDAVSVERGSEAQAVMPMATISVTEDMATAMRLHRMGWRSVYHHEVLAHGLAPEELKTSLTQRLRWAQGTVQVALRENPWHGPGLTLAQRLMYTATMWSYLSGFATAVFLAAPVIYFLSGIMPVTALGLDFFVHLLPFLLGSQLLFLVAGWGIPTWRGQQYSFALFPVWIKACTTACRNVWFGRPLGFAVTPKVRQAGRADLRVIRPQLWAMAILLGSSAVGVYRMFTGRADTLGIIVNLVWVAFDLALLSCVLKAAWRERTAAATGPETPGPGKAGADTS
ncbi:cellulose synthase [Arthrobacter sp. SW1]|uniref:glycosyltransferase family 2 protein n=1 Tax=Arthrobacter sp. SW1 TaxID=1920889 RepID=UPI000877C0B9|nr:glycosyltransferase family 2 protein [Arthrobacter sp. SW1]OFI38745.1 cellulose synthase [Arthrobacter sp. SW1]